MPKLVGMKLEDINPDDYPELKIDLNGVTYDYNDEYEKGYVYEQTPKAGEMVKGGRVRTISLKVSLGKENNLMPDLAGQSEANAMSQLKAMNLGLNVRREEESSDTVPAGSVTRTDPAAETELQEGQSVTVYVSLGSGKMPELKNQSKENAKSILDAMNLNLRITYLEEESDDIASGNVTRTVPASDSQPSRGQQGAMGYISHNAIDAILAGGTADLDHEVHVYAPAPGEGAENGIASCREGAVILTNLACYLLRANGGVEVVWRTPYDSVGAKDSREGAATTGGGLAWGGGCSPSLSRELVFFTDNLETVSLMAVDIHTGEVAASHPVIDELPANMPVSVENSAIVYDHGNGRVSTIVCNWFGAGIPNLAKPDSDSSIQSYENIYDRNWLLKGNCMIMPGVERVDTIRTADGWTMKSVWCRDDLSDTSMMKLSTATGYIYGFVQDVDSGMWQYIVLDFDTGKTVLTVDVASLYGYNNMAIGMYAGRDGNKLYCPTGYKELLRLQDRFVFLPEMPYRKVDLDKTSRRVLSAAEFQAAGGAGTPASWLHTATLDNLHPATTVSFRINGLTGNAADYKLFALGTDGRYHEVSDWHFDDAPARLSAKKVYTICLTAQDGGSFDLSPDAKEVTLSIVLAR